MTETTLQKIGMQKPPNNRLIWGGIIFISGFLSPLFIPLVVASDLSTTIKSVLSGLLALGIPEIFMIIAVAILGKSGFTYLKSTIFSWFKKYGPPDTVSPFRYRLGLILFSIPLILGIVQPYIEEYIQFMEQYHLYFIISGDILLLISLFVLGGDFWDKLRSLFVYKSRAMLISDQSQKTNDHDQKNSKY